jgi:hypothetical protein
MNREALEDDSPMDEETFAFGSFRLIPAQRMLFEDGDRCALAAGPWTFSSRSLSAPARPSARIS